PPTPTLFPYTTLFRSSSAGKSGTPTTQTAGAAFNLTVNAVDAYWNNVSATDTVGITSSDANAVLPSNAALAAGSATFSVTLKSADRKSTRLNSSHVAI